MYQDRARGWAKYIDFIILDMLCLCVSFFSAHYGYLGYRGHRFDGRYLGLLLVLLAVDFCINVSMNTMSGVMKRGYWKELWAVICNTVVLLMTTGVLLFAVKLSEYYSRVVVFSTFVIFAFLSYIVRICWKNLSKRNTKLSAKNALLIVSDKAGAEKLVDDLINNDYGRHILVGVVLNETDETVSDINGVKVVASCDNIIEYVQKNWVDEVMFAVGIEKGLPYETIDILTSMGVTVHISLDGALGSIACKHIVGDVGGNLVVSCAMNYMTPVQVAAKRLMDIIGGLAGCVLTGIIYLFIAPKIKKESPGPVFFSQTRIGRNGKPFKFYKFRSMYLDAEERKAELMEQNRSKDGLMFKIEFDPRIIGNSIDENGNRHTGIGEFIRRTSLDEFPQFYNVLRGEMSLVGTRPPLVDEYEAYSARHKARLAIKPGITGLWQISGRSNIMDFEEVLKLDTQYINNWSIGLDLKILLLTVKAVFKQEGSM